MSPIYISKKETLCDFLASLKPIELEITALHVNAYVKFRGELREDLTAKYRLKKEFGHSRALVKKWSQKLPKDWVNKSAIKQSAAKVDYYYRLCCEDGLPLIPTKERSLDEFNEMVLRIRGPAFCALEDESEPCSPVPEKLKRAIRSRPGIEREIAVLYSGAFVEAKKELIEAFESFGNQEFRFSKRKYRHANDIIFNLEVVGRKGSKTKIKAAAEYFEFCYRRAEKVLPRFPMHDAAFRELVTFVRRESPPTIFRPGGSSPSPLSYIRP